jgi:ATP/maltotriose-dependent transcriptional regulator MalT
LVVRGLIAYLAESASTDEPLVQEALEVFEARGDDAGLADAWGLASTVDHARLHWRAAKLALERMLEHAERIDDRLLANDARSKLIASYLYGPFPVDQAVAWYEANPLDHPFYYANLAQLEAMRGNLVAAREQCRTARERARERGQLLFAAGASMEEAEAELCAGDAQRAAEVALEGVAELDRLGEQGWLSTVAGLAAEALYRLGRDEEAWQLTEKAEQAGAEDDVITQMLIRQVRAKLLVRRGELGEAERLAREAVALGQPTDALYVKADSLRDLAIVLIAVGRTGEALGAFDEARTFYEQKGHTVGVARIQELRSELVATST